MELTKAFIRDVLSIPSCSKHEERMLRYIEAFAAERGIDAERDAYGNLYLRKGTCAEGERYPAFINHTDTVFGDQTEENWGDRRLELSEQTTEDGKTRLQAVGTGIGADDKLGCALALALLDELPLAKAVFCVEEELGLCGSEHLDLGFFGDVSFCLTFDCRERNRSASACRGVPMYPPAFFEQYLKPVCDRHGVTMFSHPANTDILNVMRHTDIVCWDLGNGGYLPHTTTEYVLVEDAQANFALARELLGRIGTAFGMRFPERHALRASE